MKFTRKFRFLPFGFAILILCPGSLLADYTIVLKNGRQITVKAYWEEKGMVKFHSLGGEIGLAREQIQSVQEAGDAEAQGLVMAALTAKDAARGTVGLANDQATDQRAEKLLRAEKEKGYQDMYDGLMGSIKSSTDLHWAITRGKTNPDPTLLETLEALNGRINDISSRIKDALHSPERRRGSVKLLTNSPFGGQYGTMELGPGGVVSPGFVDAQPFGAPSVDVAPPGYSAAERELSDLRRQLELLYEERKRLIEAFKEEKLFSGSVPYEAFP